MLEQPLYEQHAVAEPLKEGDPFYKYEIRNWDLSPRIYKILGISAVLNVAFLLVVAQTSLLTMKGCDSPLVGSMCQALDTIYVGATLFGTDREYVDAAYEKTDLGDVDITYVDVTGADQAKLYYPSNYWQIANPEKYDPVTGELIQPGFADLGTQNIPGITDSHGFPPVPTFKPGPGMPNPNIFDTPQHLPKSNPNGGVSGDLPGSSGSSGGTVAVKKPRNRPQVGGNTGNPGNAADPDHTAQVKPSPSPSVEPLGPVDPDAINTRPFKELVPDVQGMIDRKELDLQAPVQMLATAKLGRDGKIVPGSFKPTGSGDPKLAAVVIKAVAAFNDSNLLNYLKQLSGKDLSFFVQQDDANVVAAIKSQVESDVRAQSIATWLQVGIKTNINKKRDEIAAIEKANDPSKAEALQNLKDDLALLEATEVGTNGKELMIKFQRPKAEVQEMLQRKLAKKEAEPKQPNSSSTTLSPADHTATK